MNRKRIRQMNTALLRRLTSRPTAEYFSGQPLLERLESENYIQRFVPLYDGTRLRCGDVLELCRPELAELSGRFNYELACCLNKRVPRIYTRDGKVVYSKDSFRDFR